MRQFACLVAAASLVTCASAYWGDNFDAYSNGQQLHGVGGWTGWDNNAAGGAFVRDTVSFSAPHSVEILGSSDLVQHWTGYTADTWHFLGKLFIPGNFTGTTYFIMLNQYNHGGPYNWSVQVHFDAATNTADDDNGTGGTLAFARDTWIDLRVDINLTADSRQVYLNNVQLSDGTWTQTGGFLDVAAIDLFANGASPVYYDNLLLVPEPATLFVLGLGAIALLRRRR